MEFFTTVSQPLLKAPLAGSTKVVDLNPGTILSAMDSGVATGQYLEVEYHTNFGILKGWVKPKWIEPFTLPEDQVLNIRSGTKSKSDASQYLFGNGTHVEYNLCGEMCVAFCCDWTEFDVEDWLADWMVKFHESYFKIFTKGGLARTTGIPDLNRMLETFEGHASPASTIQEELYDSDLKRPLMTPARLVRILQNHRIIIGCTIEGQFGQLKPTGIPHWVVVDHVNPIARGGLVSIYNPFGNTIEYYSWNEFVGSTKTAYGIIVPR